MPIIAGEKWACSSCIKGHRVSGCSHSDRELHHIAPKGRPVKQCEHCRNARKSKAQHGKCDCGERKEKDKVKEKNDVTDETLTGWEKTTAAEEPAVSQETCCCNDGAPCICGLKRDRPSRSGVTDPPKLRNTLTRPTINPIKTKPRLMTAHSETTLTVFANGHHKPCHRLNNSAHTSGAPYRIPRSHTVHGTSSHGHRSVDLSVRHGSYGYLSASPTSSNGVSLIGRSSPSTVDGRDTTHKSSESLPVNFNTAASELPDMSRSFPRKASDFGLLGDVSYVGDTRSRSHSLGMLCNQHWQMNFSAPPTANQYVSHDYPRSPTGDYLMSPDVDWSFQHGGPDPIWSALDLPLSPTGDLTTYSQPASYNGDSSRHGLPALTATSSGADSETGDFSIFDGQALGKRQSLQSDQFKWDELYEPQKPTHYRPSSSSVSIGYPAYPLTKSVPGPSSLSSDYSSPLSKPFSPLAGLDFSDPSTLNLLASSMPTKIAHQTDPEAEYGMQKPGLTGYNLTASTALTGSISLPGHLSYGPNNVNFWNQPNYGLGSQAIGNERPNMVDSGIFMSTYIPDAALAEFENRAWS